MAVRDAARRREAGRGGADLRQQIGGTAHPCTAVPPSATLGLSKRVLHHHPAERPAWNSDDLPIVGLTRRIEVAFSIAIAEHGRCCIVGFCEESRRACRINRGRAPLGASVSLLSSMVAMPSRSQASQRRSAVPRMTLPVIRLALLLCTIGGGPQLTRRKAPAAARRRGYGEDPQIGRSSSSRPLAGVSPGCLGRPRNCTSSAMIS